MDADIFADDTFASLQACCPDEGGHCQPLMKFSCGQVQRKLGIPASMVLMGFPVKMDLVQDSLRLRIYGELFCCISRNLHVRLRLSSPSLLLCMSPVHHH